MKIPRGQLKVARILHEDGDFATLEVGKHEGVSFHLTQNEEGETVGGDRFLTILFVRTDGQGGAETWDPFEKES